jgi:tetratricopeptide (TPR) repeat protein
MKREDVMIEPDKKAVEAELVKARKRLNQFPQGWLWLEQVGRCLRWLGDPEAEAYFRRAAGNYKVHKGHAGDHMRCGYLHRLAGDEEAAQRHFERARALYAERVYEEDPCSLNVMHMIPASFLTGRDDEVAELIALLQAIERDRDLIAYPSAKLAKARRTQNADLAAEAKAEVARMARRSREQVWETGGPLLSDWYDIAAETWRSLAKADSV